MNGKDLFTKTVVSAVAIISLVSCTKIELSSRFGVWTVIECGASNGLFEVGDRIKYAENDDIIRLYREGTNPVSVHEWPLLGSLEDNVLTLRLLTIPLPGPPYDYHIVKLNKADYVLRRVDFDSKEGIVVMKRQ